MTRVRQPNQQERHPSPELSVPVGTHEEVDQQRPSIWVGALADWDAKRQYGDWVDAARPDPAVAKDIRRILERTPDGGSQTWGIYDIRGFGRWEPDPEDGLPIVLQVARGIVQHGHVFSALVDAVGAHSLAARPDRFHQSYLGSWPTVGHFAHSVAAESGWYDMLERLPRQLRRYVEINFDTLVEDAQRQLVIVDHEDGVWVFNPRVW